MRPLSSRRKVQLALLAAVALSAAIAVGVAGDKVTPPSQNAPTGGADLARREATAGSVQLVVTPVRVEATGAEFTVVLDNHEIELTMDLARGAALTVGATTWTPARWSGDGPSGHHREGTLRFSAAGPATGSVVLTLAGFPAPVRLEWTLPPGGASS